MDNEKIVYFSQDVKEIVVKISNHKFRMNEDVIKHFIDGTKLVENVRINKERFFEFANYAVAISNGWNDFSTIIVSPEAKWSVVIKTNNNGTKRYAGIEYYPNSWKEFCDTFDRLFLDKTVDKNNEEHVDNQKFNYETIINYEYNNKGITTTLVNEIVKFVVETIENFEQDRFWSDYAREFLGLLILVNLNAIKSINVKEMIREVSDKEFVKSIILDNIGELQKYSEIQVFVNTAKIIKSEKTFESVLELIHKGLYKYFYEKLDEENDDKMQKNKNIVIPKNIGEISQYTLSNIYYYNMNKQEEEKVKLLELNQNKYKNLIQFIKYIDGIGYIVVDNVSAMVNKNGIRSEQNIYRLIVEPELELEKAKKKINDYLKKLY